MRVGVPSEIKSDEYRVGLTPTAVREYVSHGHDVLVQTGAGLGAGFTDDDFTKAGAKLAPDAETVFRQSQMIVKVKEPAGVEWKRLTASTSCSPTSTWRPIPTRRAASWRAAARPSPMKR
jgi:alanine dehydrogenase